MFSDAKILSCNEPDYRAHPGYSYSQWKHIDSPEFFEGAFVRKPPIYAIDETADMLLGTNVHAEFLEGLACTQAPDDVLSIDKNGVKSRRGKLWQEYKATHPACQCLSGAEFEAVDGLRKSVISQPKIANLLWGEGLCEVKIAATHTETGLPVRFMLDKIRGTSGRSIIGDLKVSSIDPTETRRVSKRIYDFRYHWQAAAYWDAFASAFGEQPLAYIFIWAHNEPPYIVRAMQLKPRAIDLGRQKNAEALAELARRLSSGDWYGRGHNEVTEMAIDLPAFAYRTDLDTDFLDTYY